MFVCPGCDARYPVSGAQPDFRPPSDVVQTMQVHVGDRSADHEVPVQTLEPGPWPALEVPEGSEYRSGNRLTPRHTTYLPPAGEGNVLLDVGCGDAALGRYLAAERGYAYLGVDLDGPHATVLADGHCLPFPPDTFAAVISFAVLEHVRVPHLVASEMFRVLRPGGVVLGTVAFLEPYHMESHFHHSHLGIGEVLGAAGFGDIQVEANEDWVATDALFQMHSAGRFRGGGRVAPLATALLRGLVRTPRSRGQQLADVTGGYRFVAHKPVV